MGGSGGGDGGILALNADQLIPISATDLQSNAGKPAFNCRVYDEVGNVIETHEHAGRFQ